MGQKSRQNICSYSYIDYNTTIKDWLVLNQYQQKPIRTRQLHFGTDHRTSYSVQPIIQPTQICGASVASSTRWYAASPYSREPKSKTSCISSLRRSARQLKRQCRGFQLLSNSPLSIYPNSRRLIRRYFSFSFRVQTPMVLVFQLRISSIILSCALRLLIRFVIRFSRVSRLLSTNSIIINRYLMFPIFRLVRIPEISLIMLVGSYIKVS